MTEIKKGGGCLRALFIGGAAALCLLIRIVISVGLNSPNSDSTSAITPSQPVPSQESPSGSSAENESTVSNPDDTYFLKVNWENYRALFPFSHAERIKSVQECELLDNNFEYSQWLQSLFDTNQDRVDGMVTRFKALADSQSMSSYELAQEVVRCIQKIPYGIPNELIPGHGGIFTPNEVAYYDKGDCDTKSLMAALVLTRLGFHCVVFESTEYRHAMLGLEVNGGGPDFIDSSNGHRYRWVEMTSYDAPIGYIPEDCNDVSKWTLVQLE